MDKLSIGQVFSIAFTMKIFSIMCTVSSFSSEQMLGVAISVLLQTLIIIPTLVLHNKYPNNITATKTVSIFYALFSILWGAFSFVRLWKISGSIYFPVGSQLFAILALALVCFYTAHLGLRSLSRSSAIIFAFSIFSLVVMLVGSYSKIDLLNITPLLDYQSIVGYTIDDFCNSGELVTICVLLAYTKIEHITSSIYGFFASKLLAAELISFTGITVLGRFMQKVDYPFFTLGTYSQPFSIQRADSIYLILFTLLCIVSITAQIVTFSILIKDIFPKFKYLNITAIALMVISASIMHYFDNNLNIVRGISILLIVLLIPLIALISRRLNHEKTDYGTNPNVNGNAERM